MPELKESDKFSNVIDHNLIAVETKLFGLRARS